MFSVISLFDAGFYYLTLMNLPVNINTSNFFFQQIQYKLRAGLLVSLEEGLLSIITIKIKKKKEEKRRDVPYLSKGRNVASTTSSSFVCLSFSDPT